VTQSKLTNTSKPIVTPDATVQNSVDIYGKSFAVNPAIMSDAVLSDTADHHRRSSLEHLLGIPDLVVSGDKIDRRSQEFHEINPLID
jgi:hypothetical protein